MKTERQKLKFTKMHGIGNDYIYINCFETQVSSPEFLSIYLSDRHKGVGGDGVILICPSEVADAKMRMFNLDGSEGKMCGNGIRCVAKYIYDNNICRKKVLHIETLSGIKECRIITKNNEVYKVVVDMGKAILDPELVPTTFKGEPVINQPVTIGDQIYNITCVSMGNPHAVVFTRSIDKLDLEDIGPRFEHNPIFPEGVNTEFIEVIDEHTLKMRVWERGSGETMACGTGACASAVAACLNGYCEKGTDIKVKLLGGDLVLNYTDEKVLMTGTAEKVFDGVVEV